MLVTYQQDSLSTEADSLETRTAQAVDAQGGLGHRHARLEGNVARQVSSIGTGADHISEDGLVDLLGGQLGLSESGLGTVHGKIDGGDLLKAAAESSERSALGANNENSLLSNGHLW